MFVVKQLPLASAVIIMTPKEEFKWYRNNIHKVRKLGWNVGLKFKFIKKYKL